MGGDTQLWPDSREDRTEGKALLEKANALLQEPRTPVDTNLRTTLCLGLGLNINVHRSTRTVSVFVSSTFTDTEYERNQLMCDVYPFLRRLCQVLGLDFGTVDMRWGVREEAGLNHATTNLCLGQIERCTKESIGPAFLLIHGHKYGYRPFPSQLSPALLNSITAQLTADKRDVSLINEWYLLDTNAIPATYMLKPRKENEDWWPIFEQLQVLLRQGARHLSPEEQAPFIISVTEDETRVGIFNNPQKQKQAYYCIRALEDFMKTDKNFVDMKGNELDLDALSLMEAVRNKTQQTLPPSCVTQLICDIKPLKNVEGADRQRFEEYLRSFCDSVCNKLANGIINSYCETMHVMKDPLLDELIAQREFCIHKSAVMVGRQELLTRIQSYVDSETTSIFGLTGVSGCGKTSLIAKAIAVAQEAAKPNTLIAFRFLGTTQSSGDIRTVLQGLIAQLLEARFPQENLPPFPQDFTALAALFDESLRRAAECHPVILFLDSLDQLSDVDDGRKLRWLPGVSSPLHARIRLVVSTLPDCGGCFTALQAHVPPDHVLHVPCLTDEDGPVILDAMLAEADRALTQPQRQLVMASFRLTPTPLFLRLAVDRAIKWHSYDNVGPDNVPRDVPGLIERMFDDLEKQHGAIFVQHALGLLTAGRFGLSMAELEDVISLDDTCLDDIYQWWTPPERRIPPLLWIRMRVDLGAYLTEAGSGGVATYRWYHRQFWETALRRYLGQPFRSFAHILLAHYFLGTFASGKAFVPKEGGPEQFASRHVSNQRLVFGGARDPQTARGRVLNQRRVDELPYHLSRNPTELAVECRRVFQDLEFIEACFETDRGHHLLKCLRDVVPALPDLAAIMRFVANNLSLLQLEPVSIYQLAFQQPNDSTVFGLLPANRDLLPKALVEQLHKSQRADPCLLTLMGHADAVCACAFSRTGEFLATVGRDNALRIWDSESGAEMAHVPNISDSYATYTGERFPSEDWRVRSCTWSPLADVVLVGTTDGQAKLFDLSGALMKTYGKASGYVIGMVCFSWNGLLLATSSDSGEATVFDAESCAVVKVLVDLHVGSETSSVTSVAFSPDGQLLATGGGSGSIIVLNTRDWSVAGQYDEYDEGELTVANLQYSPDGLMLAAALWGEHCGIYTPTGQQRLHKLPHLEGMCWRVHFSADSRFLVTSSSDRTARIWDPQTGQQVTQVFGHSHRVSWAEFSPDMKQLVTCSLDQTTKLWSMQEILGSPAETEQQKPDNFQAPGFVCVLSASPSRQHLVTQHGFDLFFHMLSGPEAACQVTNSPKFDGMPTKIRYFPDGQRLLALCEGNTDRDGKGRGTIQLVSVSGEGTVLVLSEDVFPTSVAIRPDGLEFAVACKDGRILFFDASSLAMTRSWKAQAPWQATTENRSYCNNFVAYSWDGRELVLTDECWLTVYSLQDIQEPRFLFKGNCGTVIESLCIAPRLYHDPQAKHVACVTPKGIFLWDIVAQKSLLDEKPLFMTRRQMAIVYSSGGDLAACWDGRAVRLFSPAQNYINTRTIYGPFLAADFWGETEQHLLVGTSGGEVQRYLHGVTMHPAVV